MPGDVLFHHVVDLVVGWDHLQPRVLGGARVDQDLHAELQALLIQVEPIRLMNAGRAAPAVGVRVQVAAHEAQLVDGVLQLLQRVLGVRSAGVLGQVGHAGEAVRVQPHGLGDMVVGGAGPGLLQEHGHPLPLVHRPRPHQLEVNEAVVHVCDVPLKGGLSNVVGNVHLARRAVGHQARGKLTHLRRTRDMAVDIHYLRSIPHRTILLWAAARPIA